MRRYRVLWALGIALLPALAGATDTSTCEGKRSWQRSIVRTTVQRWFRSESRPDDLLELVQAEQGIAACRAREARPLRLHTTSLPRGLEPDQLGAVLLSNELEWSGLLPPPTEGLAGEWFPVRPRPAGGE